MALPSRNQPLIVGLSKADVAKTLAGAGRFFKSSRWLGKANRYIRDTTKVLTNEVKSNIPSDGRQLSQYIAVSSLLHCSDGWSYLGRSLQSLLQGDMNTSLHLAYYAELRAAMSLLACEGVGVFKEWHYVVDAPNSVKRLPVSVQTHVFAWDCLDFWGRQPTSGAAFANIVSPHGRTLEEWLAPFGGASTVAPQAREWFRQWGMDLMLMAQDREARNSASYRPAGIPQLDRIDASLVVEFVMETWELLEPSSPSSFDSLDRHILRLSIDRWFEGRFGKKPSADPNEFQRVTNRIVDDQNMLPAVADMWKDFLRRQTNSADPKIFDLSKVEPVSGATMYFAIVSRAALLLRIATGATRDLFNMAGVAKHAISFWRNELGLARGLWGHEGAPEDLTALWTDVAAALADINGFQAVAPEMRTYQHLATTLGHASACLGGCERIAVWNVAAA